MSTVRRPRCLFAVRRWVAEVEEGRADKGTQEGCQPALRVGLGVAPFSLTPLFTCSFILQIFSNNLLHQALFWTLKLTFQWQEGVIDK